MLLGAFLCRRPVYTSHGQFGVSGTTVLHPRRPSEQIVQVNVASCRHVAAFISVQKL